MTPQLVAIRRGWCDLITRYQWDWFVTCTFDPKRIRSDKGKHPEAARKAFQYLIKHLSRERFGVSQVRKGNLHYYALTYEKHKSCLLHMHALRQQFDLPAVDDAVLVADRRYIQSVNLSG